MGLTDNKSYQEEGPLGFSLDGEAGLLGWSEQACRGTGFTRALLC
jgi:hypothetical protein